MFENLVKMLRTCAERDSCVEGHDVCPYLGTGVCKNKVEKAADAIEAYEAEVTKSRWIKFTLRSLTEEEQREHPDWCYILDCTTPDDGQEILVSNGRYVWTDTFYKDGDQCYLDGGSELDDCWWKPMPEPPKENERDVCALPNLQ